MMDEGYYDELTPPRRDTVSPSSIDKRYREACDVLGIRTNKIILSQLRHPGAVVVIQLGGTYVGRQAVVALCSLFPHVSTLRWLGLSHNDLDNDTVSVICSTVTVLPSLQVIDLSDNPEITRVGGHQLLNVVSKTASLVHVNVSGTNVTEYFARRIKGHTVRHFEAHSFTSLYSLSLIATQAAEMKGLKPSSPLPNTLPVSTNKEDVPDPGAAFLRELVQYCGIKRSVVSNQPFDEIWEVPQSIDDIEARSFPVPIPTAFGTPTPNLLQYNTSPSFDRSSCATMGAFCIEHDHVHNRILFRYATPTFFALTGVVSEDVEALLQCVTAFNPKTVELPAMFRFPGGMEMMPAVHAPDAMLFPQPPGPLPYFEDVPPPAADAAASSRDSMFFSFFRNAQKKVGHIPKVILPEVPPPAVMLASDKRLACPVFYERPVTLKTVNRAAVNPEDDILPNENLVERLTDPQWNPSHYASSTIRILEYMSENRLHFNTVSLEKSSRNHLKAPNLFNLHRVIQHSATERLTSGCLNFSGTMLATSSYDMTCKVWNVETGKLMKILRGHEGYVYDVVWNNPVCDKLVTASFDKTCKVWDPYTGQCVHTLTGHELEVVCVAFNQSTNRIASGGMDDIIILWDAETGMEVFTLTGHNAEVVCLEFSQGGELVVSGSMDETVRLWDTATGACLSVFVSHGEICAVRINCHRNLVLAGSADGTCRLWDIQTKAVKVLRGHTRDVVDCDFSPDGWLVASASEDGTTRVWDVLTGGCLAMMVGHDAGVYRVAFSKDGRELLTGSADMTAKLWRIESSQCLQTLRGHKGIVLAAFNADNSAIMTLSKDNTCRIWRRTPEELSLTNLVVEHIIQTPGMLAALDQQPQLTKLLAEKIVKHKADMTALKKKLEGSTTSSGATAGERTPSPTTPPIESGDVEDDSP